jgi:hypothetical protein
VLDVQKANTFQMFLKPVELTTALRPSLLPDETLLFVQDAVGLYQGYVDLVSRGIGLS